MAHKLIDRCKETTSTAGTGNLTLAGPVSGYVGVMDATYGLAANGDTSWFCAEAGTQWEVFLGTRVNSTTLSRSLISSSTGSTIDFTAAPVVFSTVPAKKLDPGPAVSAYRTTSNQSITSGVWTKAQLNAESFDLGGCFDSATNYRWTPDVPGYYQVSFQANISGATLTYGEAALYKNGAAVAFGTFGAAASASFVSTGAKLVYMNGTTDYLELYLIGSGTTVVANYGEAATFMSGYLARAD